jgi:uncharacterized membrane protein YuzA (DUF378 family)
MNPNVKKWIHMIAFILVIIGAIDLGLFGILPVEVGWQDIIDKVFGFSPTLVEVIYVLIGISGIYLLVTHRKECSVCKGK